MLLSSWREAGAALAADLPASDVLALEARCDSAVIWAVVLRKLRAGRGLAGALDETIRELTARQLGGRFNFLLTDGQLIAATAAGDTCGTGVPGRRWSSARNQATTSPAGPRFPVTAS